MLIAMGLAAALCIGIGVFPDALYAILPYPVAFDPYTTTHVITQLQLLTWSALAFSVLVRTGLYPPELRSVNLDFDGPIASCCPPLRRASGRWRCKSGRGSTPARRGAWKH